MFMLSYVVLWVLFVVISLILIGVLHNIGVIHTSLARLTGEDRVPAKIKISDALPPIKLQGLNGDDLYLSESIIAGSAITVVSPSCSPCHTFLKQIQEQDYQIKRTLLGFQKHIIICVSEIERAQTMTSALVVFQNSKSEVVILADPTELSRNTWGINATPSTIVIDNFGRVERVFLGLFSDQHFVTSSDPSQHSISSGL
jgi:hypothetical protein